MIRWLRRIFAIFRPPAVLQVAALCLRGSGAQAEVLLVRSLDRGIWILPKGWPMKKFSLAEAAAIEAWEEAGVKGRIVPKMLGRAETMKRLKGGTEAECDLHVFLLHVESVADDYPESGKRTREWMPIETAIERLENPDLTRLLRTAQRG